MNRIRRAVAPVALAALTFLLPLGQTGAQAAPVPAGHLAFVTAAGTLKVVAIMSNGATTDPVKLAPVTKVDEPKVARVHGLVVSADKRWLAWSEEIFKPSNKYGELQTSARIVVRNMFSGQTTVLRSNQSPLGFAGSTLVTVGAYNKRLVKKPTPHLVRIPGDGYAIATYDKGIVDVKGESKRLVFQAVHMMLEGDLQREWKPGEDRYSRMVFIGRNLDEAKLKAGFEACAA